MNRKPGSVIYTAVLNARSTFESDITAQRIAGIIIAYLLEQTRSSAIWRGSNASRGLMSCWRTAQKIRNPP